MNNVTMETVASLHSPYGRVKVKTIQLFLGKYKVQNLVKVYRKGMVPLSTKSLKRTQKGADLEKNL